MWECVGGDPLLRLVRGVDEPEEEPKQHSQLLVSVRMPGAMMFKVGMR